MQEAQVVRGLLFPADQQPPGTVEPGMRAFDLPPARFRTAAFGLRRLVGFTRHMRRVTSLAHLQIDRFACVAFIEAKMLRLLWTGLGTLERDSIQCFGDQFLVRHIGAVDRDGQGHTAAINQRRSLHTQLAAIGRVFAGFSPRPAATW